MTNEARFSWVESLRGEGDIYLKSQVRINERKTLNNRRVTNGADNPLFLFSKGTMGSMAFYTGMLSPCHPEGVTD